MKPKGSRALTIVTLLVVGAVAFLALRFGAVDAVYPVEKARQLISRKVVSRIVGLFHGAQARAENIELRRDLASLSVLRTDIERLESENRRLRDALGYLHRNHGEWVAAGVLSSGGGAVGRRVIRVDKGSEAGIKKGAVVIVPDGVVGRVSAVSLKTSEIALIIDPSVPVSVDIETDSGGLVRGVVCGGDEGTLSVRYVRESNVQPRARVVTSGVGGVFPKGLEVGSWRGSGEIVPSVDYAALEDVFIRCEK